MSETLALAELRNLRRYAFCLLGNRNLADITVESALSAALSTAGLLANGTIARLDLYRNINQAARSNLGRVKVAASALSSLHARLLRLNHEQREVLVLRSVIGLSFAEIAAILSFTEAEAARTYMDSLLALRIKPINVLIIEDEALIAREIEEIVSKLGLGVSTARNREEALRLAGRSRPQLILADYKLRNDTGLDVVNAIREKIDATVIYITAHPQAVRDTGDLVICKPFNPRLLAIAVQTHLAA